MIRPCLPHLLTTSDCSPSHSDMSSCSHWVAIALLTCWLANIPADDSSPCQPGLLIKNKPGTWYSLKVSNPVVLRLGPQDFRMWAYGREVGYKGSPGVSFGRTGYFVSKDGLKWTAVPGPAKYGSVMSPNSSCGSDCFDSADVGVTDVVASPSQGVFYQWYMGIRATPNSDQPAFGTVPATRGGVAVSYDGINWVTCRGPKSYGSWLEATPGIDSFVFLMTLQRMTPESHWAGAQGAWGSSSNHSQVTATPSWNVRGPHGCDSCLNHHGCNPGPRPSLVPDCARSIADVRRRSSQQGPWKRKQMPFLGVDGPQYRMFYNSLASINGSSTNPVPVTQLHVQLFGASGRNIFEFDKTGAVSSLAPAVDNPLAMDFVSTGSARVLALPKGGYLLFYEGVNATNRYSIGLARSTDGVNWHKDTACTGSPGGPVLRPGSKNTSWDYYVGTPFPLLQPDGRIFLYYVGFYKADPMQKEGALRCQVGLAVGHVDDPCKFVKYVSV